MNDKKRSKDDIRRENEKLKSRINQEFGGISGSEKDIPPELENQFLKNILAFEEQYNTGKETTVYDRIGRPRWIPADTMLDQQLTSELHRLQGLLIQNGISLDTICEVDDRELYRFITQELFAKNVMDIAIPGMMTHFIYEEFYPNHAYDSEQTAREFITHILFKNVDTADQFFNTKLKLLLSPEIDTEKSIVKVKNFINSWSDIGIERFEVTSVEVSKDDQEANVDFEIAYEASLEDGSDVMSFEGPGRINLRNVFQRLECVGWEVVKCDLPGFKL